MQIGIRKTSSGIENTSTNTSTEFCHKPPKALNIKAFGGNWKGEDRIKFSNSKELAEYAKKNIYPSGSFSSNNSAARDMKK